MPPPPDLRPLAATADLLGPDLLARMHEAAVAMLTDPGMLVQQEGFRAAIAGRKGFTFRDGRVRIAGSAIAATLSHLRRVEPAGPVPDPAAPFTLGIDDRATWIVAADGRKLRPLTLQDVIDSAKLVAALKDRGVRGSTSGFPTDVPGPLAPVEQYLVAAEYAAGGGHTSNVTDVATAEIIRELDAVYGRGCGRTLWNASPLIFGGPEADILWRFRDEAQDVYIGSMPTMGFTGPCDPIGVFTLGIAECLGSAAIVHELMPNARIRIGPHPEPVDPASGSMVFGTPEWDLLDLMHREIHAYYGTDTGQKLIHTTASVPGPQAVADHAGSMMLGALHGYRHFSPGGMLGLDEVWSPAMLVLDVGILEHTRRIARGVWSGAGLGLADLPGVVRAVISEDGLFADHETTIENMRDQYHRPKAWPRLNRAQWEAAGRPDDVRAAQAEADRLIAAHRHEPPPILGELRKIYDRVKSGQ